MTHRYRLADGLGPKWDDEEGVGEGDGDEWEGSWDMVSSEGGSEVRW